MIYGNIVLREFGLQIPEELKLTEEDIFSANKFKTKLNKVIKYHQDNNSTPKTISKLVYGMYWAILGNTFGGSCKKYEPKFSCYVSTINEYCDEKQRGKIKKDMDKTIEALDKLVEKGKPLSNLQKDYYKDLKANVNKIK